MKTLKDIRFDPRVDSYFFSLSKLLGKSIVDAKIGFTREWGDTIITVYSLVLEDGETLSLQGEHDIVYIEDSTCSQEQLDLFYEEDAEC